MTSVRPVLALATVAWLFAAADGRAAPALVIDKPRIDVGTLYDDQKMCHTFTIGNRGDSVLMINRVLTCTTGGCSGDTGNCDKPCKSYVLETNAIPPGGSAYLKFAFDMYMESGAVRRPRTLYTNDPEHPTCEVEVSGTVLHRYVKSPRLVTIDAGRGGDVVTRTVEITGTTPLDKPLSMVKSSTPYLAAELCRPASGGACEVLVKTVPPLPDGLTRGEVVVSSADSNVVPCVVRVLAYVHPAFCVIPESVLFQQIEEPQLRILFVRQNSRDPAGLRDVSATFDGVSCRVSQGPGDGNYRVYVEAEGLSGRTGSLGEIVVATDRPGQPEVRIPVEVRGVILAPGQAGK